MNPRRRLLLGALGACVGGARAAPEYPAVTPRPLEFPRDFGAHLPYRTEWWYLTGLLDPAPGTQDAALGIQLTFFRVHPPIDPDNPSRFAAHQVVLAHAAIADPGRGALLYEERIARTGFGVASVSDQTTRIDVEHWNLEREPQSGVYRGLAQASSFALQVTATPTQPLLLQGDAGYSRKGPDAPGDVPASFYYSEPQLALSARVSLEPEPGARAQQPGAVSLNGRGWLDHEWSSRLLPAQTAGWDWVGLNLDDGSVLTAFRIRRAGAPDDAEPWFSYASLRVPGGPVRIFGPSEVRFEPLQRWTSPRTRATYPVAQRIAIGARRFETRPLMPDQELDAPASGTAYWEGASEVLEGGRPVGRGYLELTGYAASLTGPFAG